MHFSENFFIKIEKEGASEKKRTWLKEKTTMHMSMSMRGNPQ